MHWHDTYCQGDIFDSAADTSNDVEDDDDEDFEDTIAILQTTIFAGCGG